MSFEMHHAVERNDSTFNMKKKTEFVWPKNMTAIKMPSQRKFIAKIMKSFFQK